MDTQRRLHIYPPSDTAAGDADQNESRISRSHDIQRELTRIGPYVHVGKDLYRRRRSLPPHQP